MTTTVKVYVNGNYIATVRKTNRQSGEVTEDTIDACGQNGGVERSYPLGHPADATFDVTERYAGEKQTEGLSKSEGDHLGEASTHQQSEQRDAGLNKKPSH